MNRRGCIGVVLVMAAVLTLATGAAADPGTQNITIHDLRVSQSDTQAGAHPKVGIFFRFCGPGISVLTATKDTPASNVVLTLGGDPGPTPSPRRVATVRGAEGNISINGQFDWDPGASLGQVVLQNTAGKTVDGYVGGSARIQMGPNFDCAPEDQGFLKDFRLKLPPGFLGNPTAAPVCPLDVWQTSTVTCQRNMMLGFAWTNTLVAGGGGSQLMVTSPVWNVETVGDEPARLGTGSFPADPAGPFPVLVDVRTTGDRGINSTLNSIPRNLGGPTATTNEIYTALCDRTPCVAFQGPSGDIISNGVNSDPAHSRPFFVNPTSCGEKTFGMEARSWLTNAVTSTRETTIITTGCDQVPFDLDFDVDPSAPADGGTQEAGKPSAQDVVLSYPRSPVCDDPDVGEPGNPDCWYENDPIWQAQLKDITQSLPDGLRLSPGGGVGLEGCTYEQFGVDSNGEQLNDEPAACPPGSQIGSLTVRSPVLANPVGGKVFFGPTSGPGRPTAERPWKLFLVIEGAGLRIKLAGDVIVAEDGTVSNVFLNQPELPFGELKIRLKGGDRAPLVNPDTCGPHTGHATLTGWNGKTGDATPELGPEPDKAINQNCPPADVPFAPNVDDAFGVPKTAGAYSESHIIISRGDGQKNIRNIKLSLPAGAVGSLAAVPKCQLADARAGNCPADTRVGTVRNTVGFTEGSSLIAEGGLFLGEASQPGDAASIVIDVPAKAGPIDLGDVVLISRVVLRANDTGVDVFTNDIPKVFGGVPLPLRRIEISVDRPGFFLNPTGCEPRPLVATFDAHEGGQSSSTRMLNAEDCDRLPFDPQIRLIAGSPGLTDKGDHPPLTAIVTQQPGEANIKLSKTVLPDILRPNSPELNEPGGLCAEAQFVLRQCPAGSLVGNARAITPVLPFELAGPVYIVQETVDPLPRLFVLLRGGGFEVSLKARNFFEGIRTVTLFDNTLPDVPQSFFQLNIDGGPDGILNNWSDLCKASPRAYNNRFTSHSGKTVDAKPLLEVNGCDDPLLRAAFVSPRSVQVKGRTAKIWMSCRRNTDCKGTLSLRTVRKVQTSRKSSKKSYVTYGRGRIALPARRGGYVNVRLSTKGMRVLKLRLRSRVTATASISGTRATTARLTLVAPHL